MVHQDPVFDEVEDVVKVSQVSDVDNLSPEETKKEKRISTFCQQVLSVCQNQGYGDWTFEETGSNYEEFLHNEDEKNVEIQNAPETHECVWGCLCQSVTEWD